MRVVLSVCVALLMTACPTKPGPAASVVDAPGVRSLDGRELAPVSVDPEFLAQQEAKLSAAREALASDPDNLEAAIWVGRHLGYVGRYHQAIAHYSAMLKRFEDEPRLLRHRGHRRLTVRDIDGAIADFERAAQLIEGKADRVEEDGLPNDRNQPTSTLGTNVYYHLGLAYFVEGDFAKAREAYESCLTLSKNPDMEAATRHWLYMTLRRLGDDAAADEVLAAVDPEWDIIENLSYFKLLLLARGELKVEVVLGPQGEAPSQAAALFGVAHHDLIAGRTDVARARFESLTLTDSAPNWASFGVLAAEAELLRLAGD